METLHAAVIRLKLATNASRSRRETSRMIRSDLYERLTRLVTLRTRPGHHTYGSKLGTVNVQ